MTHKKMVFNSQEQISLSVIPNLIRDLTKQGPETLKRVQGDRFRSLASFYKQILPTRLGLDPIKIEEIKEQ